MIAGSFFARFKPRQRLSPAPGLPVPNLALPEAPRPAIAVAGATTRLPVDLCKRGEMRVERFIDAATVVFTEKGYRHARLSEIVARAGGSLATLYRVFGDKEGLAHAIIQRRLRDLVMTQHFLHRSGRRADRRRAGRARVGGGASDRDWGDVGLRRGGFVRRTEIYCPVHRPLVAYSVEKLGFLERSFGPAADRGRSRSVFLCS